MKTTQAWLCTIALLVPGLTGCGGSSSSGTSSAPLAPRTASATLSNGLTAMLAEDRTTVAVGGTVTYTITLTNSTAQTIIFQPVYGPGSGPPIPVYLTLTDPLNHLAYPLGASAQIVYLGQNITLTPGQSISTSEAISTSTFVGTTLTEGYGTAGNYTATATFGFNPIVPTTSQSSQPLGPVGVRAQ